MARKSKAEGDSTGRKIKSGSEPLDILSLKLGNIDAPTLKRHLLILFALSLLTKLVVITATTLVFHSFIDLFDIGFYFDHGMMLTQGQLPYINYFFDYPILIFVPILLALVPALLLQDTMVFVYSFQFLMVVCDLVITLCVYLISLKVWDKKIAFYSGMLYATAFSAAYFILTKYDAFPTAILMVALLFTIYGLKMRGYAATAAGFFAKIFPVIALPFIILFNAKESTIKKEIISSLKIFVPLIAVLILPFLIFRLDIVSTYLPVRTGMDYYSNTLTFTIYSWLHGVFGLGISLDTILTVMFVILAAGLFTLVYIAYSYPRKDAKLLLKLILSAIILVIFCVKVRSPQYLVWFTPLLCILAADDIRKMILVYFVQCMAFIEFPLFFRTFYTSTQYTDLALSTGWYTILVVFTLEYLVLFACIYIVVNPGEIVQRIRKTVN
jgi:hypothetical protein